MSSVQQHALDEARVLCIYTGGTIGMLLGPSGYRPEPYFLTESLQSQARFNDPSGASFFSHASSSQGFQQWNSQPNSNAGSADPSRSPSPRSERQTFVSSDVLRVRSSRPIGVVKSGLSASDGRGPSCRKLEDDAYEADLPALVTPLSTVHGGPSKRIRYAILEVEQAPFRMVLSFIRVFLVGSAS
jgi:lysophospholipase